MANNRPYFALNAHRLSSIESEEIENYWKKQAKDHKIPQGNVFDDVRAGLEQRKENMKKGQNMIKRYNMIKGQYIIKMGFRWYQWRFWH